MCSITPEYNKPRRRPGASPLEGSDGPILVDGSAATGTGMGQQQQQAVVGAGGSAGAAAAGGTPTGDAAEQHRCGPLGPPVAPEIDPANQWIRRRWASQDRIRRLSKYRRKHSFAPWASSQQRQARGIAVVVLTVLIVIVCIVPFGAKSYMDYVEWDREWLAWEMETQRKLVESLPEHVAAGLPAPSSSQSSSQSQSQSRLVGKRGKDGVDGQAAQAAVRRRRRLKFERALGSNGGAAAGTTTPMIDFDSLGKRRDSLVKAARDAASHTVHDSGRYPPPPPLSASSSIASSASSTVPVLGVTVHVDPQRFLPRLLYSIDSPVDAIVVTWYGNDDDVSDGIRSFLGDRFVPVAAEDNDDDAALLLPDASFDGSAVVSRFRLRRIADWDGKATTAAAAAGGSGSRGNVSPASIPCREFVVMRYPTNLGCSVGFNNPILLYPTAPYWLLVNYDVSYPPGVLANIGRMTDSALRTHPSLALHTFGLVYGRGHVANPWSNFAVTARSVAHVGLFDENIFPAYYEDDDYRDRVRHVLGGTSSTNDATGNYIDDSGIIVKRSDRSVAVVHGPIDAKTYVSGNDQVMKINKTVKAQWRAYNAISENGRYFQCKHGGMPRMQLPVLGVEVGGDVDRYFRREDRFESPFGDAYQSWDEWTFNATRRRCVHDGVEVLVPLSGLTRWQKARELAEKCAMC